MSPALAAGGKRALILPASSRNHQALAPIGDKYQTKPAGLETVAVVTKKKNVSRWSCVARCEGVISGIEMGSCRQAPEAGLPSSLPWFKPQNEIQGFPKSGPKLEFLIAFYVCKRPLRRLRACILSKEICAATFGAKQGSFQHQPGLDNVTCQTQTS